MIRLLLGTLALLSLLLSGALSAGEIVLDAGFHHLRNTEAREWSHFPKKPHADRLEITFDLANPADHRLLTLRQEETKQPWVVTLNGQKIGTLLRDHNHLEHGIALPEELLHGKGNVLEIATASETPDDIRLGDLVLHDAINDLGIDAERQALLAKGRGYQRAQPGMDGVLDLRCTEAETGEALPCRFTIVDAETGALAFVGAESDDRIAVREGVVYALEGKATVRVRAGRSYRVFAGRGFEYSLARAEVAISEEPVRLALSIRREVPTPGLVACDTHLHTFEFDRHGDCTLTERLLSIAGEGVELPISTGHDKHIDYGEEARRLGAARWFTPVLGCEVTTSLGHFNSFPIDPGSAPAQHKLRPWPKIFQNIYATPGVRVCILNHGRDLHRNFRPLGKENFDPETGGFFYERTLRANGIEIINSGATQSDPLQLVRDWFALLKAGHRISAVGSSDSHTVNFAIPGQGRTYLEADDSDPSKIDTGAAIESFLAGRTWVSFGLLTRLDLEEDAEQVQVTVLGPGWTTVDRVRIYRNGQELQSIEVEKEAGTRAGEKFRLRVSLSELEARPGDFLCAVATGPGLGPESPWWPMMPPYQPDSVELKTYVFGMSPAVWMR